MRLPDAAVVQVATAIPGEGPAFGALVFAAVLLRFVLTVHLALGGIDAVPNCRDCFTILRCVGQQGGAWVRGSAREPLSRWHPARVGLKEIGLWRLPTLRR